MNGTVHTLAMGHKKYDFDPQPGDTDFVVSTSVSCQIVANFSSNIL